MTDSERFVARGREMRRRTAVSCSYDPDKFCKPMTLEDMTFPSDKARRVVWNLKHDTMTEAERKKSLFSFITLLRKQGFTIVTEFVSFCRRR